METTPRPRTSPEQAVRVSLRWWASRSKQAVVALVLVGSALFVGPVAAATTEVTSPAPVRMLAATSGSMVESEAQRDLGARLAMEYAGAVPATDVESLVRDVSRQLREASSPRERLLHTTEAVCRRALTDFLARGVPLPVG